MATQAMEKMVREQVFSIINPILEQALGADVLDVSASEIAIPILDAEGNEIYVKVKVTVPRGKRDDDNKYIPYDGYEEHEAWEIVKKERAEKKATAEANRAKKKEASERKKDAKKTIKTMKDDIKEVLPSQVGA